MHGALSKYTAAFRIRCQTNQKMSGHVHLENMRWSYCAGSSSSLHTVWPIDDVTEGSTHGCLLEK